MRRLGIVAVGLLVIVSTGCSGADGRVKEYARQMQGYFSGFTITPERDDVENIAAIEPPRELALRHEGLKVAAAMVMLAEEHEAVLEASEQQRLDQEQGAGGDVISCVNMEYDTGMTHWASVALRQACSLHDAALDAYAQAELEWSMALSKACGGPDWAVMPSSAIDECLK
jgi:hypothetical protein